MDRIDILFSRATSAYVRAQVEPNADTAADLGVVVHRLALKTGQTVADTMGSVRIEATDRFADEMGQPRITHAAIVEFDNDEPATVEVPVGGSDYEALANADLHIREVFHRLGWNVVAVKLLPRRSFSAFLPGLPG